MAEGSVTEWATREFPCAQCGAKMQFDPTARAVKCPYCGHETPVPQDAAGVAERDYLAALAELADRPPGRTAATVKCRACHGETTLDPHVSADTCPFCGSALLSQAEAGARIAPHYLLPFKVPRAEAYKLFRGWVERLWFAPNKLKRYARSERNGLAGLYVPYWTYDAHTESAYQGERGDDYWVTEHYTTRENGRTVTKTRQVRKTRWSHASGTVSNVFDDLLVLASHSLPAKHTEALEPWDLANLVPYDEQYLAGFRTELYQVDLAQGFDEARQMMDGEIRASICRDIGGDHQRIHAVETEHRDITFKHLLLPVWLSAYRFRDKTYRFLVNARTGEVQGERPWSWAKITLTVLGALALAALVVLALHA